jgi:hypothetical protein
MIAPTIIKISRPRRKKRAGLGWAGRGGACGWCWEEKNSHRFFVGTPEGKRLLGRPRNMWEDENAWAAFVCFNKGTNGELL